MRGGRLVLLAAVGAALLFAAPALAKPRSELEIDNYSTELGKRAPVDIALHVASDRAPAADAVVYVPQGYGIDLSTSIGEKVGWVGLTMFKGSTELQGNGSLIAADPEKYATLACAPGPHAAVWLLKATVSGTKLTFPMLVDPAADGESAYALHLCLPPTSETGGQRLVWADVEAWAFRNPTKLGSYWWRAVVQSYAADGSIDASSKFEVQSEVTLPHVLSFTMLYDKVHRTVRITGRVVWAAESHPGVRVYFGWASKLTDTAEDIASVVTDKQGRFTVKARVKGAGWVRGETDVDWFEGCTVESGAWPCELSTVSAPPPVLHRLKLPKSL